MEIFFRYISIILVVFMAFLFGMTVEEVVQTKRWEEKLLKLNYAEYDKKTGEFRIIDGLK